MQLKYISPYFLIMYIGVFGFILSILCSVFLLFDNDEKSNTKGYFRELGAKGNYEFYFEIFFVTPLYAFINFMEITCKILTVYYLNPLYILITNNFCYGLII